MVKSLAIILFQLHILYCQCLTNGSSPQPLKQPTRIIVSRKNGLSKQFNIGEYNNLSEPAVTGTSTSAGSQSPANQLNAVQKTNTNIKNSINLDEFKSILKSTFLPNGFPSKTPHGYLEFSIWSWIQDFSTQLRAILATQRVLEGVGVGREGATALSASINFIVRDGCGMASTLMFTALTSNKFRSNVKKWRLFADIMNDIGITLEVAATLVPRHLFLPMICLGNMCKAICGVGAGACNGAINVHWSKGSDISDINAKFGAQHTVTSSLGLIFAALFAKSVNNVSVSALWFMYTSLTALHIYANMKCLRLVVFDYFNTERITRAAEGFLDRVRGGEEPDTIYVEEPITVSSEENLLLFGNLLKRRIPIKFGVSFDKFVGLSRMCSEEDIESTSEDICHRKYSVALGPDNISILVVVSDDSRPVDKTKGYFHALILRKLVENDNSLCNGKALRDAVQEVVDRLWPHFERNACKVNWDLSQTELAGKGYEISIQ